MSHRDQLVQGIRAAATLSEQARLVAELDAYDRSRVQAARSERALDLTDAIVRQTLTPVRTHELHTAATEWLDNVDTSGEGYHQQILAEAALWYSRTSPEVKADTEEFREQALGKVRVLAGKYGERAEDAAQAALQYLAFLHRREAASTLDQVEQTTAPDGVTYKPTDLPVDVFDNFAPPVHPINEGVSGTETSQRNPAFSMDAPSGDGSPEWNVGHQEAPVANEQSVVPPGGGAMPGPSGSGAPEWSPGHQEQPMLTHGSVAISHLYSLDDFRTAARDVTPGEAYPSDDDLDALDGLGYTAPFGTAADPAKVVTTPGNIPSERIVREDPQQAGPRGPFDGGQPGSPRDWAGGEGGNGAPEWAPGHQVQPMLTHGSKEAADSVVCPTCKGSGAHPWDAYKNCPKCKGTGLKNKPRKQVADALGTDDREVQASRKQAVDGDSQSGDREMAGSYLGDQNTSDALTQLMQQLGEDDPDKVRQAFPNPQAALEMLQRRQGVKWYAGSPYAEDHDDEKSIAAAAEGHEQGSREREAIERLKPNKGQMALFSAKEAASTLDQIQQTTAPDGVTYKPTPMPPDVAFPIVQPWQPENTQELDDAEGGAAVDKAAALDDATSSACRACGGRLGPARKTGTGEAVRKCAECGASNYVQNKAQQVSAAFTPDDAFAHRDFRKGYAFASKWDSGKPLVTMGSAEFEAGLYAGITDNPAAQVAWVTEHAKQAAKFPVFATRMGLHDEFTRRVAKVRGLRTEGAYVRQAVSDGTCPECLGHGSVHGETCSACKGTGREQWAREGSKTALTETDLNTSVPGTSPSATGDTPIHGPGHPGPLDGKADPAAPGGPAPYNGAYPQSQPVVPGAVPPVATDPESMVTRNGPPNPMANAQTVAFRKQVQANLLRYNDAQEG